jgi:hypothetical protein
MTVQPRTVRRESLKTDVVREKCVESCFPGMKIPWRALLSEYRVAIRLTGVPYPDCDRLAVKAEKSLTTRITLNGTKENYLLVNFSVMRVVYFLFLSSINNHGREAENLCRRRAAPAQRSGFQAC